MSQKELNYFEDIYNHEKLVIDILNSSKDLIDDDNYITLIDNQVGMHNDLVSDLDRLIGDICGE